MAEFLQQNSFGVFLSISGLILLILFRKKLKHEWHFFRTERKAWFYDKWKNWGEPFVVALVLAIVIRTFLLGPYKIPTGSMKPTFQVGDRIFVDKISYRFRDPERGEIIVFKYPLEKKKDYVKRLIGLPGETLQIKEGKVFVNGEPLDVPPFSNFYYYNREDWDYGKYGVMIDVPKGHYFVLGDNSGKSSDSRNWGFVPQENIVGRTVCIWWPPRRVRLVN
ncbi:MAG: signal peptidase I [Candidatus Omnitrophica bacterium]|nr:signal peptidase I [Candidatus Omnitrophota bacterium]